MFYNKNILIVGGGNINNNICLKKYDYVDLYQYLTLNILIDLFQADLTKDQQLPIRHLFVKIYNYYVNAYRYLLYAKILYAVFGVSS